MSLNLISTKLRAPRLPLGVVERPRLHRQLEAGLRGELILISAPAGSGKSTLLGSWLARLARPTAWLSLDKSDDDPERFLSYLIAAVQQVEPGVGTGLHDALQLRATIEAESLIIRLINDIAQLNRDMVLVLDDYHLVSNLQIHGAVDFLLDHMPLGLCLVISTRRDPPLALSRLRVRGQLIEIRAEDLRFSVEETATFLNDRQGLQLSAGAVASLEGRTEGWIAGLQLAALSLGGREDKEGFVAEFAGSHRYLVEYLIDEVLSRQTPENQQFLQRTAILERFTASLCGAVSLQPDSPTLLRQLVAANLFLIPLDDEQRWYRYHHLFAEFLSLRLRETEPELLPELHRRASAWFEHEGWTDEAIVHALAAGDHARAGRMVEAIAFDLGNSSHNAQLVRYVSRFPPDLLSSLPRLCIYYGWALINTGQVVLLSAALPVIEQSAAHVPQPHLMAAAVLELRAYERLWQMDFAGVVGLCQEALAVLDQGHGEPGSDEERWIRTSAHNVICYSHLHSDLAQTDAAYPAARALSQKLGNVIGAADDFARHGWVMHQLGRSHEALELFHEGLTAVERWKTRGSRVVNVGELYLYLARLLYEWNRLDEAQSLLNRASEFNQRSQFPPVLALECETACLFHLATGEPEAAQIRLGQLDRMLAEVHPSNLLYQHLFGVMAMKLRLRLVAAVPAFREVTAGLIAEVVAWVRARHLKAEDDFDYAHEGGYVVLSRLLLVQGRAGDALLLLGRLARAAQAEGRIEHLIHARILQALGHHALGQQDLSLEALESALELAKPEGYCRSFVDAGPALRELLVPLQGGHHGAYVRQLLTAVGSSPESGQPAAPPPHPFSAEPISERERSVLRLLAAGQTYKEIARTLHLSPNTVRWYMQTVNTKLGASNRTQAVNRARELGLL